MAKAKKPSKNFMKKVHHVVESDIFKSVAIASVLLNVLFLVSVVVLTSTSTFDRAFFKSARNRYCQNIQGVQDRAKELGDDKKAVQEWQIDCIGKGFQPYYNEAIQKFEAQPVK